MKKIETILKFLKVSNVLRRAIYFISQSYGAEKSRPWKISGNWVLLKNSFNRKFSNSRVWHRLFYWKLIQKYGLAHDPNNWNFGNQLSILLSTFSFYQCFTQKKGFGFLNTKKTQLLSMFLTFSNLRFFVINFHIQHPS